MKLWVQTGRIRNGKGRSGVVQFGVLLMGDADSHRFLAVNAVSLVVAVDLSLLPKKYRGKFFGIVSAMTIIGWYISSFVLIGLAGTTPAHLPLPLG